MQFVGSMPHPDEEQLALKLYAREIEESNLYGAVAGEILSEWKEKQGYHDEEQEERKIILI